MNIDEQIFSRPTALPQKILRFENFSKSHLFTPKSHFLALLAKIFLNIGYPGITPQVLVLENGSGIPGPGTRVPFHTTHL